MGSAASGHYFSLMQDTHKCEGKRLIIKNISQGRLQKGHKVFQPQQIFAAGSLLSLFVAFRVTSSRLLVFVKLHILIIEVFKSPDLENKNKNIISLKPSNLECSEIVK